MQAPRDLMPPPGRRLARMRARLPLEALGYLGAILGAVVILWLRFNGKPAEGHLALRSDLFNYYYPMTQIAAERLVHGELPLWNPSLCSGIPLLATTQVAVFYPGLWLSVLLPGIQGLSLLMLSQCVAAGCFFAFAFRSSGCSWFAASTGGIVFTLGCVMGGSLWPPQVSTIVWLPWLLCCIEMLSRRWQWRWWLAMAAGTALQILAGFPQYLIYSFFLLTPFALFRLLDEGREKETTWRALGARGGGMVAAVLLGVALASIQLLPTLELAALSARSQPLSADQIEYVRSQPPALLYFLNALDPARNPIFLDYGKGGGYLGIASVLMAAVGIAAGRRSLTTWLLVLMGVSALLLSDGSRGLLPELHRLYSLLPGVDSFRTPERLRLIYLFCFIALAVRGFDEIPRRMRDSATSSPGRFALVAAAACPTVLIAQLGGWDALGRALFTLLIVGMAAFVPPRPWLRRGCQIALFLMVVGDLFLATGRHGIYRDFPEELSKAVSTGAGHKLEGAQLENLARELGEARVEFIWYRKLVVFRPLVFHGEAGELQRISCREALAPAPWPDRSYRIKRTYLGSHMGNLEPGRFPTLYDVAGVRKILRPGPNGEIIELENPDALPRAYQIERYRLGTQQQILRQIEDNGSSFRQAVALEEEPGGRVSRSGPPRLRRAKITSYAPEEVRIEVGGNRDSLLVLSDTYYPGWVCKVDGVERRIMRANGAYRAVRLGPGAREVIFEYRPASLRWGRLVSLAALVLFLAIASQRAVRLWRRPSQHESSR